MTKTTPAEVQAIAGMVAELEEELEVSGYTTVEQEELTLLKARLYQWVDSVVGVVSTPALGRVTLIHGNGRKSSVASPDLPFALSTPRA